MALYAQIPKKQRKDQARYSCARMAVKSGYPRKRPGNIPADTRGVQVRPEWITRHEKENYTLGRIPLPFSRALVLCAPVRSRAARLRKCLFAVLRLLYRQTVRSTAQAVKTPYKAKYKRKRHKKSLHIDNYILRCYALGNYKAVKGF